MKLMAYLTIFYRMPSMEYGLRLKSLYATEADIYGALTKPGTNRFALDLWL